MPDLLAVTKTDSNGYFSFETTEPGPYEINCFRGGGHFGSGLLNVDPNKFAWSSLSPRRLALFLVQGLART